MITAANMDRLRKDIEHLRVTAANGTLPPGAVEVLLDRIDTMRNQAYDTPYLRALESMYTQTEALLEVAMRQTG